MNNSQLIMPEPKKISALFLLLFLCHIAVSQKSTTEILWDNYGVPHIYGENAQSMYFGFGWAQMQNHANLILKLYAQARGKAAEYFGKEIFHLTAMAVKPLWSLLGFSVLIFPVLWMPSSWIPALAATKIDAAKTRQTAKKHITTIVVLLTDLAKSIIEKYGNEDKSAGQYIFFIIDIETIPEKMKPKIINSMASNLGVNERFWLTVSSNY